MTLQDLLRQPNELLQLEPEELAGCILEYLVRHGGNFIARANFATEGLLRECPMEKRDQCAKALMEGWAFLENAGLLAAEPGSGYTSVFVTRKGRDIVAAQRYPDFRAARMYPRESLHPIIARKTYGLFLRGEYETAVFQAMKEVEVAVRTAGGCDHRSIGVDLMVSFPVK
jgi:hypothetical protein